MKYMSFLSFFTVAAALAFASNAVGDDTAFPTKSVYGKVSPPQGEGLLAAFSVAVKLSAPGLQLREPVRLDRLVMPEYPETLFNIGVVGEAEVAFDLTEDGK